MSVMLGWAPGRARGDSLADWRWHSGSRHLRSASSVGVNPQANPDTVVRLTAA